MSEHSCQPNLQLLISKVASLTMPSMGYGNAILYILSLMMQSHWWEHQLQLREPRVLPAVNGKDLLLEINGSR